MATLMGNIPPELRGLQRWVCSNADSKMPMRAFAAAAASVSKPDTWASFEEAEECVEGGIYEYAGFVFDADGFVGIDIDCGFDEDGLPTEEALAAIRACRSYTEVSKSGKGFHIICKGDIPFRGKNNRKGWEIYREGRFFVLTGQTVMFTDIAEAQEGIDAVLEAHFSDEVAESSSNSGNRQKIWKPSYTLRSNGKVPLCPTFEPVTSGSRHLSLVSYCGQIHRALAHKETLLKMALTVNERYMEPPLGEEEVRQIVDSVTRYRR